MLGNIQLNPSQLQVEFSSFQYQHYYAVMISQISFPVHLIGMV